MNGQASRPLAPPMRATATRPPDTRPPAGPGRGPSRAPHWDPVRFCSTEPPASPLVKAETAPLPGAPEKPLPDPAQWAAAVAQSAVEALLGIRPVTQLSRWLATPVYQALSRRAGLALRVCGPARTPGVRIRSVTPFPVDDTRVEASVTLHDGRRFRAAALRLERFHGRWLVTALEIG